jgi:hypothetical protein
VSTAPIPALFRDYEDLRQLKRRDPQSDHRRRDIRHIEEFARRTRAYAEIVRRNWPGLPEDQRNNLRAFAYQEAPARGFMSKVWVYLRALWWLVLIVVRGQHFAIYALGEAFDELRRAVLDAIERENPAYQVRARAAVEHAVRPSDARTVETPEEIDRWLAELSDKADRRV